MDQPPAAEIVAALQHCITQDLIRIHPQMFYGWLTDCGCPDCTAQITIYSWIKSIQPATKHNNQPNHPPANLIPLE